MDVNTTEGSDVVVDLTSEISFEEARSRFRGDDQARAHAAADAAAALLALAGADAAADLASHLCPDPADTIASYTLVSYEFGDVIPSSVRDFTDPVAAVDALRRPDDPDHAAAELVTVTHTGLRWIPLVRSGERIVFQVPDVESVSSETLADRDIEQALLRWYRAAGLPMTSSAVAGPPTVVDLTEAALAGLSSQSLPTAAVTDRLDVVDERLHSLAGNMNLLAERLTTLLERSDPSVALERRLAAIERRLDQAVHDVIGEVAAASHQQSEYALQLRRDVESADARQRERLEATARWLASNVAADLQKVVTEVFALRAEANSGTGAAELEAGIERLAGMLTEASRRDDTDAKLDQVLGTLRALEANQTAAVRESQRLVRVNEHQGWFHRPHLREPGAEGPGHDDL